MAFRPNTTYSVSNGGGSNLTFYKAIQQAEASPNGTKVTDASGKVIFTKNGDSNTYYLYQFNESYGTTDDKQGVLDGTSGNYGKMLKWVNDYRYSKAIDGRGFLSNSHIHVFHKHSWVNIKDIYEFHKNSSELSSGGYYHVRTLSSSSNSETYSEITFTVPLKNITTNLTSATNAYIFGGFNSGSHFCECGLQLRKEGSIYKWYAIYNASNPDSNGHPLRTIGFIANMGATANITVTIKKNNGSVSMTITKPNANDLTASYYDTEFNTGKSHEAYRTISFCPETANNTDPIWSDFNNSEYFKNAVISNCKITKSGTKVSWPYNASFNQYAVNFNDEFIESSVSSSQETVNISYKGRNTSDTLII